MPSHSRFLQSQLPIICGCGLHITLQGVCRDAQAHALQKHAQLYRRDAALAIRQVLKHTPDTLLQATGLWAGAWGGGGQECWMLLLLWGKAA